MRRIVLIGVIVASGAMGTVAARAGDSDYSAIESRPLWSRPGDGLTLQQKTEAALDRGNGRVESEPLFQLRVMERDSLLRSGEIERGGEYEIGNHRRAGRRILGPERAIGVVHCLEIRGGPQVYRLPASGGGAQRVTFNGDYNISPRLSPDGRLLSYVGRRSGRFQVMVLDIASGTESPVTDTARDESPSFAPNGRLLLYATEVNGRGILASASVDGRVRTRLTGPAGDIREPTWGPFIK